MQGIIGEYLQKSGIPREKWNFLTKEQFLVGDINTQTASENSKAYTGREVFFNTITFGRDFSKTQFEYVTFLKNIMHELVHTMSHNYYFVLDPKACLKILVHLQQSIHF